MTLRRPLAGSAARLEHDHARQPDRGYLQLGWRDEEHLRRSPKIYFSDTGLASHLLGIGSPEEAMSDPLRGNLYENLVVLEVLKKRYNLGKRPELYFFRDSGGMEVDLIVRRGRELVPVEIKSAETFTDQFLKGIEHFRKIAGDRCKEAHVLYNGAESFDVRGVRISNPLKGWELDVGR